MTNDKMKEFIVRQLIAFLKPFRQPFFAIFDLITFKFQKLSHLLPTHSLLESYKPSFLTKTKILATLLLLPHVYQELRIVGNNFKSVITFCIYESEEVGSSFSSKCAHLKFLATFQAFHRLSHH